MSLTSPANDSELASADLARPMISIPKLMALLLPTAAALYGNFQGVQQILAPARVQAIDPSGKIGDLAVLTMICAVTGILGLTVGGAASDATSGRWGRRAPWLVAMGALGGALTILMGSQGGLAGLAVCYGALWFALNAFQGALLAVTPDRVPDGKRSLASSIFAVAGPLGVLLGVNLAAMAPNLWGHVGLAVVLVIPTVAFVVFAREAPYPAAASTASGRWRSSWGLLKSFGSRDFSLAYAFRLLMFIGQFSINNYLLYILQDHVGADHVPGGDARLATGALNSLRMVATVAAIGLGYWLAHRTERRRIFAQVYALLMAASMLAPIVSPTWNGMLVFGIVGGFAIGLYSAIDLTLMSRVLPSPDSAGRDLALLVMAGASAQLVAPVMGGGLIRWLGYDALFGAAACVTLAAGLMMSFLRGVR